MSSQQNSVRTTPTDDIPGSDDWQRLDDMLKVSEPELPDGIPILPSEDATDFSKYRHQPRAYAKGETWANCARTLEKHDADLCKAYREEIDTLLVFAGLFSAVVTAFSVESYRWLQPDPNDAVVGLLAQIAQSVAPNSTTPVTAPTLGSLPPAVSTRINAYWFTSLALSLSSTLVAILCKQWIREFERTVGISQETYVAIRQIKYEGLQNWKVGDIVSALPLLLQLSLGMFLVGVIELLWRLHVAVAAAVCIPTLLALVFYLATTFLPLLQHMGSTFHWRMWERLSQCPYKSPQAFLTIQFFSFIDEGSTRLYAAVRRYMLNFQRKRDLRPHSDLWPIVTSDDSRIIRSWGQIDRTANDRWVDKRDEDMAPGPCFRGFDWLRRNVDHTDVREWVWNCMWDLLTRRQRVFGPAQIRGGIWHLLAGSTPMPEPTSSSPCARSLALQYVSYSMASPRGFVIETFIQNLHSMDAPSACALLSHITQLHRVHDLETAISLVRVLASFSREHMSDDLSGLFSVVTAIVVMGPNDCRQEALRACVIRLVLNWVRFRTAADDDPETFGATTHALKCILWSMIEDPADFLRYPERLHELQHVQDLAAVIRIYFEACGLRISWPLPEDPQIPPELAQLGADPILIELLKLSVRGEAEPAASSGDQMEPSLPLQAPVISDSAGRRRIAHPQIGRATAAVLVDDVGGVRADTYNLSPVRLLPV